MRASNLEPALKDWREHIRLSRMSQATEICYFEVAKVNFKDHVIEITAEQARALVKLQINAVETRMANLGVTEFE